MSQVRSKFTNTVIGGWGQLADSDLDFDIDPEPEPEPDPEPSPEPPRAEDDTRRALAVWSPTRTAIVARGFSSKVFILDEVDLPLDADPRLVLLTEPDSPRSRSLRLLRHRLLAHADPRVIAVTSAEPGEGKTTAAVNLALCLADETMARVLLIEGNMRRPALGPVFGFEPSESFVGRMIEQRDSSPPYSVAAILGTRLQVAALGASLPVGARLDRMLLAVALQELREAFDYVVIDAASVLESADADVAAECADGVILTARVNKSKKSALRRAVEQLSPARVLGTVLFDA
jgi:Mrp family chromosome partitioning ATPase